MSGRSSLNRLTAAAREMPYTAMQATANGSRNFSIPEVLSPRTGYS